MWRNRQLFFLLILLYTTNLQGSWIHDTCDRFFYHTILRPVDRNWCQVGTCWNRLEFPPVHSRIEKLTFKKTKEEFNHEHQKARSRHPDVFGEMVQIQGYRLDRRGPDQIVAAEGFFPNPQKPQNDLASHTMGPSAELVGAAVASPSLVPLNENLKGSGSYVSFSKQEKNIAIFDSLAEELFNKHPDQLVVENTVNPSRLASHLWKEVTRRKWGPKEARPTAAAYQFFEYKVEEIEGVEVIGGAFAAEKEIITLGYPLDARISWRRVLILFPLQHKDYIKDGDTVFAKIQPFKPVPLVRKRQHRMVVEKEWHSLLDVAPQDLSK